MRRVETGTSSAWTLLGSFVGGAGGGVGVGVGVSAGPLWVGVVGSFILAVSALAMFRLLMTFERR